MAARRTGVSIGTVSRRDFLRTVAAGAAVASTAGLGAVGDALAQTAPKKGGTLRVGFYIEAATMDPHLSGSKIDRQIYHNIYEPLVMLDDKLGIKPGLAESWQQPDPKTLVFKLRQGVKFHDGTDFNAEAVKFNFNRMKTEPKSVRKGEVANVDSVDVVDAYTIKLNLKKPDADAARHADRSRRHDGLAQGRRRSAAPELERNAKGAGTGPVRVRRVDQGRSPADQAQRRLLEQAGRPVSRPHPLPADSRRHGQAAEPAGRRDRRDGLPRAAQRGAGQGRQEPGRGRRAVAGGVRVQLNTTKPPFDNKALRQAVAYAIDTRADRQGRVAQRRRAGQRADPADELGVRQTRSRRSSATWTRPRPSWPRAASRAASASP